MPNQVEIAKKALAQKQAAELPTEGPAFSHKEAAVYLNVSVRQTYVFEEQGELFFFPIGPKLKKTTKPLCDDLIKRAIASKLAELEGQNGT